MNTKFLYTPMEDMSVYAYVLHLLITFLNLYARTMFKEKLFGMNTT